MAFHSLFLPAPHESSLARAGPSVSASRASLLAHNTAVSHRASELIAATTKAAAVDQATVSASAAH